MSIAFAKGVTSARAGVSVILVRSGLWLSDAAARRLSVALIKFAAMTTTAITVHKPHPEPSLGDLSEEALEPSALLTQDDQERVARAVEEALAPASRRAYASALRTYRSWLVTREGSSASALQPQVMFSAEMVSSYLTRLAETGASPSSIETARAAIIHASKDHGLDSRSSFA